MRAHREDLLAVVEELIGGRPDVHRRKMFGYPAFFAGAKLAVCVMDDEVGLRVPPDAAEGLRPFVRSGRRMRGWSLLAPETADDVREDARLLLAALERAEAAA